MSNQILAALDHNIDRLADDHANAKALVRGLGQIQGLVPEEATTNLVFFDCSATGMTAGAFAEKARRRGLAMSTTGKYRVRACTHLDVSAGDIDTALSILRDVVA